MNGRTNSQSFLEIELFQPVCASRVRGSRYLHDLVRLQQQSFLLYNNMPDICGYTFIPRIADITYT